MQLKVEDISHNNIANKEKRVPVQGIEPELFAIAASAQISSFPTGKVPTLQVRKEKIIVAFSQSNGLCARCDSKKSGFDSRSKNSLFCIWNLIFNFKWRPLYAKTFKILRSS